VGEAATIGETYGVDAGFVYAEGGFDVVEEFACVFDIAVLLKFGGIGVARPQQLRESCQYVILPLTCGGPTSIPSGYRTMAFSLISELEKSVTCSK
jgi:hypothetical protein